MQATYIYYKGRDASLLRTVARSLALSGAGVVREPDQATAVLSLPVASVGRRVLAKDTNGRPREYEINVVLVFSLHAPDGFVLVPRQRVQRRENVVLDPAQPLASAGEVSRAAQGLRDDAIWDMLRVIAAAELQPRPVEAGEESE